MEALTVAQLIAVLQQLPQDATVYRADAFGDSVPLTIEDVGRDGEHISVVDVREDDDYLPNSIRAWHKEDDEYECY